MNIIKVGASQRFFRALNVISEQTQSDAKMGSGDVVSMNGRFRVVE